MAYRTLRPLNPETIWPTIKISKSEIQTITAGKGFERLLMHHKPSASAIQSEISVFCITKLTKNGFGYQVPIHDISEFSNLTLWLWMVSICQTLSVVSNLTVTSNEVARNCETKSLPILTRSMRQLRKKRQGSCKLVEAQL